MTYRQTFTSKTQSKDHKLIHMIVSDDKKKFAKKTNILKVISILVTVLSVMWISHFYMKSVCGS